MVQLKESRSTSVKPPASSLIQPHYLPQTLHKVPWPPPHSQSSARGQHIPGAPWGNEEFSYLTSLEVNQLLPNSVTIYIRYPWMSGRGGDGGGSKKAISLLCGHGFCSMGLEWGLGFNCYKNSQAMLALLVP